MILIDTSVWVDHFRRANGVITALIANDYVGLHPYVLGELTLGGLPSRGAIYDDLLLIESPPIATPSEVLAFIARAGLSGTGIGYVDTHLLSSARMMIGGSVLTADKRLRAQAERLGLAYQP